MRRRDRGAQEMAAQHHPSLAVQWTGVGSDIVVAVTIRPVLRQAGRESGQGLDTRLGKEDICYTASACPRMPDENALL